jgi:hypothetical protein
MYKILWLFLLIEVELGAVVVGATLGPVLCSLVPVTFLTFSLVDLGLKVFDQVEVNILLSPIVVPM